MPVNDTKQCKAWEQRWDRGERRNATPARIFLVTLCHVYCHEVCKRAIGKCAMQSHVCHPMCVVCTMLCFFSAIIVEECAM